MLVLLTILFLALLILGHECGHFLAAKILGIKVEEFGVGFPPKLWSKRIGHTEYSVNAIPFGGFVRIYGENSLETNAIEHSPQNFQSRSFLEKIFVVIAGVLMNTLIGWIAFSLVIGLGIPGGLMVERVVQGGPAQLAGIQPGDLIEGFQDAESFIVYIDAHRGQEIVINGRTMIPRTDTPSGEGPLGIVIVPSGVQAQPFPQNIWSGLRATFETLGLIFSALGSFLFNIFTGHFGVMDQVAGPVGVFNIVRDASQMGYIYLIQLFGLISLNLAALNTIPFPALDGGRFMFITLQKLLGKKLITRRLEATVNALGFIFLIILMLAVTIKDIMNLS